MTKAIFLFENVIVASVIYINLKLLWSRNSLFLKIISFALSSNFMLELLFAATFSTFLGQIYKLKLFLKSPITSLGTPANSYRL